MYAILGLFIDGHFAPARQGDTAPAPDTVQDRSPGPCPAVSADHPSPVLDGRVWS
jgi:hypothetical protein